MTVILHIKRSSGTTEMHELRADGDHIAVPFGLLESDDVLGFDVEVPSSEVHELDLQLERPDGVGDSGVGLEARG